MNPTKIAKARAIIERLAETWPAAFSVFQERRRPLRIGIREDILAVLEIDPRELGLALGIYCRNQAYLRAIARRHDRVDLAGQVVDTVTAEQAEAAAKALARGLRYGGRHWRRPPRCQSVPSGCHWLICGPR